MTKTETYYVLRVGNEAELQPMEYVQSRLLPYMCPRTSELDDAMRFATMTDVLEFIESYGRKYTNNPTTRCWEIERITRNVCETCGQSAKGLIAAPVR